VYLLWRSPKLQYYKLSLRIKKTCQESWRPSFRSFVEKPKIEEVDDESIPVIEEAPNHSEGAIQDIGNNCHPGKEVVVINEGEAKGL
jgi:hypothetical protein